MVDSLSDVSSGMASNCSTEQSKAIAQRFYDAIFNQHNLDQLDQFLAPHFIWHEPHDPSAIYGIEASRTWLIELFHALPDYQVSIENLLAEGEQVAIRWTATGTHLGMFKDYKATHQELVIPGISMMQLKDGKIVEYWTMLDNFLILAQMGAFEEMQN